MTDLEFIESMKTATGDIVARELDEVAGRCDSYYSDLTNAVINRAKELLVQPTPDAGEKPGDGFAMLTLDFSGTEEARELNEQVDKLRAALQFYADEWQPGHYDPGEVPTRKLLDDAGEVARLALQIKKLETPK